MTGILHAVHDYREWRHRAYAWRYGLPAAKKVGLAVGMAALTGLLAQVRIQLPFTTVPLTGQVLAVLLAGVLLGRSYGGLSQVLYVGLGAAGLPWFAGFSSGYAVLTGDTGGYLVGFVVAAALLGYLNDRYVAVRRFWPQVSLMALAVAVIYACGACQYALVWHAGAKQTILLAVLPFAPADALKVVIAACISTALLPKSSFDGEIDAASYSQEA